MPTRSQKSTFSLFGEDFQNVLDEASDEDDADLNSDCGQHLRHDDCYQKVDEMLNDCQLSVKSEE